MENIKYALIYLVIINLLSFIMFYIDKKKAKRDKWRIKESTLHLLSFLGGTVGSIVAMVLFHHKTKKTMFRIITAAALIFNCAVIYILFK